MFKNNPRQHFLNDTSQNWSKIISKDIIEMQSQYFEYTGSLINTFHYIIRGNIKGHYDSNYIEILYQKLAQNYILVSGLNNMSKSQSCSNETDFGFNIKNEHSQLEIDYDEARYVLQIILQMFRIEQSKPVFLFQDFIKYLSSIKNMDGCAIKRFSKNFSVFSLASIAKKHESNNPIGQNWKWARMHFLEEISNESQKHYKNPTIPSEWGLIDYLTKENANIILYIIQILHGKAQNVKLNYEKTYSEKEHVKTIKYKNMQ